MKTRAQVQSTLPFDPEPYQSVPQLTTEGTVALAAALVAVIPQPAPALIDRRAQQLAARLQDSEQALTVRHRESAPVDHSGERALDLLTDGLWVLLRDRLRGWSVFEQPALDEVLEGPPAAGTVLLEAARERAGRASTLLGRVFGSEGVAFIQRPYPEQVQRMAAILRLVDEDGLAASIDELVGPEVLEGLRHCQRRYEAMVERRMARDQRRSIDLSQLRRTLHRSITRYAQAVLVMVDDDDPESVSRVRTSLRPIEVARAQLARSGGRTAESAPVSPGPDASEGLEPAPVAAVAQ